MHLKWVLYPSVFYSIFRFDSFLISSSSSSSPPPPTPPQAHAQLVNKIRANEREKSAQKSLKRDLR